MPEVIGIDHIYITVSNLGRSETFYDGVMEVLGDTHQIISWCFFPILMECGLKLPTIDWSGGSGMITGKSLNTAMASTD